MSWEERKKTPQKKQKQKKKLFEKSKKIEKNISFVRRTRRKKKEK